MSFEKSSKIMGVKYWSRYNGARCRPIMSIFKVIGEDKALNLVFMEDIRNKTLIVKPVDTLFSNAFRPFCLDKKELENYLRTDTTDGKN